MTILKIIRLLHLLGYLVLVSQMLFYLLVMADSLKLVSLQNFVELRKIVDPIFVSRVQWIYYATLILSIVLIIMTYEMPPTLLFITAIVAFICLLLDALIGLNGNVPLNELINSYAEGVKDPTYWEAIRTKWLDLIKYRAVLSVIGFVALLVGALFERN